MQKHKENIRLQNIPRVESTVQNIRLKSIGGAEHKVANIVYALGAEHRLCMYATYLIIILARRCSAQSIHLLYVVVL